MVWRAATKKILPIVSITLAIIGLIFQFLVTPIFGMQSKTPTIISELTISNEDRPPPHFVYVVDAEGKLHSEYSPSNLYNLRTEETFIFKNPIFSFPWTSITCYPTYEGSKLVKTYDVFNLVVDESKEFVTVHPSTFFVPHESKITIRWEKQNCLAEGIKIDQEQIEDATQVVVSNSNEYPVLYIAMVDLPPLKENTTYQIEIENSYTMLYAPHSIKIERTNNTSGAFYNAQLPVEVTIGEFGSQPFDVLLDRSASRITLSICPPGPPVTLPTPLWIWIVIPIGIVIIITLIIMVCKIRRRY